MILHIMNLANHQYWSTAKGTIVSLTSLAYSYDENKIKILAGKETQA